MAKSINIFLGSSIVELKDERKDLSCDISGDIEHLLRKDNINVHFVKCENNHSGNDGSRDQDYYNQLLKDCEYSVFLFKTRLGARTAEEFAIARELQKTKRHIIFIYFLQTSEDSKEQRLKDFQDRLDIDWEECPTISEVRYNLAIGLLDRLGIRVENVNSPEDRLKQFIELRQDIHQEVDNMLVEIKRLQTSQTGSVAAMVMNVISIYRNVDRWAVATGYNKEKYIQILSDYANFLYEYGLYNDSKSVYLRLIPLIEEMYGMKQDILSTAYNNIGEVCRCQGDYSIALDYHTKSLKIKERLNNKSSMESSYNNIGLVYYCLGESTHNTEHFSKAIDFYKKAIHIQEELSDIDPLSTALVYNNIGLTYNSLGDGDLALEYFKKALSTRKKLLGEDDANTASSYNNIGSVYFNRLDYSTALIYYEKANKIYEMTLGYNHPETAATYNNIGSVYFRMHEHKKALEYFEKSMEIGKSLLGDSHPNIKMTQVWIDAIHKEIDKR